MSDNDQLTARISALEAERDALAKFKAWVHAYLDQHGVPHHPPGPHGAEGCRIGDRMDHVFAERDASREVLRKLLWHYPDLDEVLGKQGEAAKEIVAEAKRIVARGDAAKSNAGDQ